jgi:hypothetical protein
MKKSNALATILMMGAMMGEGMGTGFEEAAIPKITLPPPTPLKSFKEQDGIINLIKEYNLIKKGESKKGKMKQARIITKIEEMIEKGYLTKDDLKP